MMVGIWRNHKYAIVTTCIVIGCILYYHVDPASYAFMPKCPVKLLTTLDCPGCGFQRALHATLHGHFVEAVNYNLFLLIAIPITCIWCLNGLLLEKTTNQNQKTLLIRLNYGIIYFYIIGYFAWFVIRNIYNI